MHKKRAETAFESLSNGKVQDAGVSE